MTERLDSADEFIKTLAEVELLLQASEQAARGVAHLDRQKVAALNKAALLLLTGKFEAFLENSVEDFLGAIKELGALGSHIPARLLAEHSVRRLEGIDKKLMKDNIGAIQAIFVEISRRWADLDPCSDLDVSCRFSYGKHGETEVIKLFKRIGFDDVFAKVLVKEEAGLVYDDGTPRLIDIKVIINSLTGMRNNILHQDATPNLTTDDLRRQSAALQRFATALVAELQSVVDEVNRRVRAGDAPNGE